MQMGDYSGAPAGRKRESKALPKTYLGGKSSAWQKGKGQERRRVNLTGQRAWVHFPLLF